jgi:hypothetical protein
MTTNATATSSTQSRTLETIKPSISITYQSI